MWECMIDYYYSSIYHRVATNFSKAVVSMVSSFWGGTSNTSAPKPRHLQRNIYIYISQYCYFQFCRHIYFYTIFFLFVLALQKGSLNNYGYLSCINHLKSFALFVYTIIVEIAPKSSIGFCSYSDILNSVYVSIKIITFY